MLNLFCLSVGFRVTMVLPLLLQTCCLCWGKREQISALTGIRSGTLSNSWLLLFFDWGCKLWPSLSSRMPMRWFGSTLACLKLCTQKSATTFYPLTATKPAQSRVVGLQIRKRWNRLASAAVSWWSPSFSPVSLLGFPAEEAAWTTWLPGQRQAAAASRSDLQVQGRSHQLLWERKL